MPTLKGTEASLSYVQCFLYLVSLSACEPVNEQPDVHACLHNLSLFVEMVYELSSPPASLSSHFL